MAADVAGEIVRHMNVGSVMLVVRLPYNGEKGVIVEAKHGRFYVKSYEHQPGRPVRPSSL